MANTIIDFQKINPIMNSRQSKVNLNLDVHDFGRESMNQSFQSLLELQQTFQEYDPDRKANLQEAVPVIEDESLFPAFLSDPVARGLEKMVMVISDEDGNTVGAVGESGIATFCSLILPDLFEFGMNLTKFAEMIEPLGFTVETYPEGKGPTYAKTFNQMFGRFGIKYDDKTGNSAFDQIRIPE